MGRRAAPVQIPDPLQPELPLGALETLFPRRSARAEFYIWKIRELLSLPVHRNPAADLWDVQFRPRDRAFLLRLAGLDPELHRLTWFQIGPVEQARLVSAFCKLRDWVAHFRAPLDSPDGQ